MKLSHFLAVPVFGVFLLASASQAQGPQFVNKVETGRVALREITEVVDDVGSAEAWQEIEISAKTRGLLVDVPVMEGQHVKAGDLLFQQDLRPDEIALDKAQAELERAQAELKKMHAGFQPKEIEAMKREVAAAKTRRDAARDDWERLRPLADQEVISASEATRARTAYEVTEAELSRAQARLALIEDGFRSEEVQIAYAGVKAQEANVADIKRRLDDHSIESPAGGIIVKKLKEPGEWVNEGEGVVVLLVLDPIKLRIEVAQSDVTKIKPGLMAKVSIDGLPGKEFQGEVMSVIPQATTGSRNFPVLIKVSNEEGLIAAGMFTRVSLNVGDPRPALAVPRFAVRNLGYRQVIYRVDPLPDGFVFSPPEPKGGKGRGGGPGGPKGEPVIPDSIASEIEVEIVTELEDATIIRPKVQGELIEGSEVILQGQSRLKDGDLLKRLNQEMPGAGG